MKHKEFNAKVGIGKFIGRWVLLLGLLGMLFASLSANATQLTNIQVKSGKNEAQVILSFKTLPTYTYTIRHNPERIVVDINQSQRIARGLPMVFSGNNMLSRIWAAEGQGEDNIRLVFDLIGKSQVSVTKQGYNVIFHLKPESKPVEGSVSGSSTGSSHKATTASVATVKEKNSLVKSEKPPTPSNKRQEYPVTRGIKSTTNTSSSSVVVAIDAGHGGQDPGAIGSKGLEEKSVTLAIARQLKTLMADDPLFKPVLTRNDDYFVSVMGRSEVARKQQANLLVSIHADAAPNRKATGASVWVLSNRRANSEMATWLEQHEKQSELLGGAGDVLANSSADKYLSQAVIDLQFGHSQRVGYDVASQVLQQIQKVSRVHKHSPEHASLGVLRSPDIPSLLVETGFISNSNEERLLGSRDYQQKIAQAIYTGIRHYFMSHPLQGIPNDKNHMLPSSKERTKGDSITATGVKSANTKVHQVKRGETLLGIANRYGITMTRLMQHNNLEKGDIWVGQRLHIPAAKPDKGTKTTQKAARPLTHSVKKGETLTRIAATYGVSMSQIKQANKMNSTAVQMGQTLVIPLE